MKRRDIRPIKRGNNIRSIDKEKHQIDGERNIRLGTYNIHALTLGKVPLIDKARWECRSKEVLGKASPPQARLSPGLSFQQLI